VSHLLQQAVADLWSDPQAARTVARAAAAYDGRRTAMLAALATHGIEAAASSGLNVWVPVPDETRAVTGLLQAGFAVAPGARFRVRSGPAVRVTVADLALSEVPAVSAAIAAAVVARGAGSSV
jgi:DNA-binding transcriptional MocR family regulator